MTDIRTRIRKRHRMIRLYYIRTGTSMFGRSHRYAALTPRYFGSFGHGTYPRCVRHIACSWG